MARPLIATALLLAGCFRAPAYSPQRTIATWRAMQPPPGATTREQAAAGAEALTAEQAYALALANNPDLAVLAAEVEVAEAGVRAAKQIENPQLRLTGFRVDDVVLQRPGVQLGLRVPIPRPGTVRARVQGAKLGAEGQQSSAEDAKRRLRARVYKLYARLAMLTADREQVGKAAELRGSRRAQIGARVDQAVATRLDGALADVAHAEARDELARITDAIADVEGELARLVGAGRPVRFAVDPAELRVTAVSGDRAALTERALAARPELRAAQLKVSQAQADEYLARSEAWPWFDWAQIQYQIGNNAIPAAFGFGMALNLPIFSWNRGEIRAARAVVRQRELEERARISAVAGEVDEAIARAERTARRVQALEQGLLPQVEAASREAEAALAAGTIDPVAAGEVAARGVEARRAHLAALLEHREAVIDLEAALGGALERR